MYDPNLSGKNSNELLNAKGAKCKKSTKFLSNVEAADNEAVSTSTRPKYRQATPHPNKTQKTVIFKKLSENNLFNTDDSDHDDSIHLENQVFPTRLNTFVETNMYNKRKSKKVHQSKLKRLATPYQLASKKIKSVNDNRKSLVPLNLENEYDSSEFDVSFANTSELQVSTSEVESPIHIKKSKKKKKLKVKTVNKVKSNGSVTRNKYDIDEFQYLLNLQDNGLAALLGGKLSKFHKKLKKNKKNKKSKLENQTIYGNNSTVYISPPLTKAKAVKKTYKYKNGEVMCNSEDDLPYVDCREIDSEIDYDDLDKLQELDTSTSDCSNAIVLRDIRLVNKPVTNRRNRIQPVTNHIPNENNIENNDNSEGEVGDLNDMCLEVNETVTLDSDDDTIIYEDHEVILQETLTGNYECVQLNDALLIILHENTKLYFHGLMSVTVLHGEVQIFGYTLTSSAKNVEIYSPRGSSFLSFEAKTRNESSIQENVINTLMELDANTAKELCKNLLPNKTLILCKKILTNKIQFLQKHVSQQIFPKCESQMPQCVFQNKIGKWNVLKTPHVWNTLIDDIKPSSRVFLCGGKSVGKSTMLRYAINRLLSKFSEILVIDLDPGQPEFTLPGCISATVVNEPVFGPNYTHLRKPKKCLFVPHINIAYDPDCYLNTVKELFNLCNEFVNMPVLINYMGFTRGLGLEIFAAAVAYAQPTTIIEIHSNSKQRNFKVKQLTPEIIAKKKDRFASSAVISSHFTIHRVQSAADDNQGWHLEPRQIREMSILSYLGQLLPEDVTSLTDSKVPTYVVDITSVSLIYNGEVAPLPIINGKLVALCSLNHGSTYICHGWGVVRAIDQSKAVIYLSTPVPPDELVHVYYLILGSVDLPPSLYMTADNNTGLVPFVSEGDMISMTLAKIPKRSHLPAKSTRQK